MAGGDGGLGALRVSEVLSGGKAQGHEGVRFECLCPSSLDSLIS